MGSSKKRKKNKQDSSSEDSSDKVLKTKRKKRKREVSSSSSSESSSSDSDYHKKRKLHRQEKKEKKKLKKLKKKLKKLEKQRSLSSSTKEEHEHLPGPSTAEGIKVTKTMVPMTKEEWQKQQNEIRREFDPTTGRSRLVRGDGEIVEEIVSKAKQKEINKAATIGDGIYYQKQTGLL